jgi:hypothetical protein
MVLFLKIPDCPVLRNFLPEYVCKAERSIIFDTVTKRKVQHKFALSQTIFEKTPVVKDTMYDTNVNGIDKISSLLI